MEKMWLVVQGKTNGFLPSWRRCVMLKNGVQFPCPVLYCNELVLSTNESEMQKKQGVRELEYERGFLTGNTNLSETELFIRLVPRMWTLHPLGEKSVRTPAKPHPKIEQALSAKTSRPAISLEYHFLYNSPNKKIGFGVKPKYCNKDWKPTRNNAPSPQHKRDCIEKIVTITEVYKARTKKEDLWVCGELTLNGKKKSTSSTNCFFVT